MTATYLYSLVVTFNFAVLFPHVLNIKVQVECIQRLPEEPIQTVLIWVLYKGMIT